MIKFVFLFCEILKALEINSTFTVSAIFLELKRVCKKNKTKKNTHANMAARDGKKTFSSLGNILLENVGFNPVQNDD